MGAVTGESNHVFGDRGSLVQQPVDSTPNSRTTVTAAHEWNHMCTSEIYQLSQELSPYKCALRHYQWSGSSNPLF